MSSPERPARRRLRGAALIELMVGLAVGVLVVATAVGALLVARDAAGGVSDLALLQQQAAHALRVMGTQIRPAGSLGLQVTEADTDAAAQPFAWHAFSTAGAASGVRGEDGKKGRSDRLSLSHAQGGQARDCLGQEVEAGAPVRATFSVHEGSLRCDNGAGQNQPLADNVASLQLRYRALVNGASQSLEATQVGQQGLWASVTAIEVCLDLQGQVRHAQHPETYLGCEGGPVPSEGRLHLVSRKLFALRRPPGGGT